MPEKILLVNEEQRCSTVLRQGILSAGYDIGQEIVQLDVIIPALQLLPVALVINVNRSISRYFPVIKELKASQLLPVIVFAKSASKLEIETAIRAGVHALIIDSMESQRVPAILEMAFIRFAEQQMYDQELQRVKKSLEDRKIIDRAKGVLMDMRGMKEQEAYASLRKLAMDQNKRMAEVCNNVIEMFKHIA